MGGFKDMWAEVDALAEKARMERPVWCVWVITQEPSIDDGYGLYRRATRAEAIAAFIEECGNHWKPADIQCRPATDAQVKEHQAQEAAWGVPPGPQSPRLKMEKI